MNRLSVLFVFFFISTICLGQEKQYKVACIGFYNFENLFDTEDDPTIRDEEFLPDGERAWTKERYNEKLDRLAEVVEQLGKDVTPDGLSILGVSEIENRKVLEDFVQHPKVKHRNYQIVHFDSPDKRGIDVGLIYQPKYFKVKNAKAINLDNMYRLNGDTVFTRNILLVSGELDGETMHVLVNHWPSRSGGEKASQHLRIQAAARAKTIVDSLEIAQPGVKVLVLGDLNDDPVSPSIKDHLRAKRKASKMTSNDMYNPFYNFYKKGIGTTAYRDAWSLFDQIIISNGLINDPKDGYYFYKSKVFNKPFLIQKSGKYKGYPFRSFAGGQYMGGYSDHYPVYVILLKEV